MERASVLVDGRRGAVQLVIVAEIPARLAGGVADDEALGMLSNTEGGGKLHAS